MNTKLAEAGSELDDYVSAPQMILYNFIQNHWPDCSDMSDASLNSLQSQVSLVVTVSLVPVLACALLCKHATGKVASIRQLGAGLACASLCKAAIFFANPDWHCSLEDVRAGPGLACMLLSVRTFMQNFHCSSQVSQAMADRYWPLSAPLLCSAAYVKQPQFIRGWALLHAASVAQLPALECCLVQA